MTTDDQRQAFRRLVRGVGGACPLDALRARARSRWHGDGCPVLGPLTEAEFARVARDAAGAGLVMRQDTASGVLYWTPGPSRAIGSPLDAEVEAFRERQRKAHPADLPGQLRMFGEGERG